MKTTAATGLIATALAVATLLVAPVRPAAAADKVVIGTGSASGVYYQVGRAICRVLRQGAEPLPCESLQTPGSISNLQELRAGNLVLGVVQSDWQYHAVKGSGPFLEAGADQGLRALFSVHGEPFTVVARVDSGIRTFDDLAGKRVNIGNPGSGQRATMEVVMGLKGWDRNIFSLANELPASQQSLALCHDRVQAMVYTVGHPNPSVAQATGLCDARIVPVAGPDIQKLVQERPYYAMTEVPGGMYAANPDPVVTFGVKATVVARADLDEDTAYRLVSAVFDHLDAFRRMHPAFGALEPARMAVDGLSAPLHPGAARYFREKGLGR